MSKINYVKGDATQPIGEDNRIIVHICNDIGGWGRGFVLALSNRWKEPEAAYCAWHKSGEGFDLGEIILVQVEPNLWVCNMIGQHHTKWAEDGTPPIRYEAVRRGLQKLAIEAKTLNASVHMPRMGAGLAGGNWEKIEAIVLEELVDQGLAATVYDFG